MEKIAVECNNETAYIHVQKKAFSQGLRWSSGSNDIIDYNHSYNRIGIYQHLTHTQKGSTYYEDNGYTIIPASEYLGGSEVEFKVGDRVELLEEDEYSNKEGLLIGYAYTVGAIGNTSIKVKEGKYGYWVCKDQLKLIKENNMKENNINKNVLEVFGDLPAKEVVIIDRHFTNEMLNVILMDKFKKEIKAACIEAEEKLKEEE